MRAGLRFDSARARLQLADRAANPIRMRSFSRRTSCGITTKNIHVHAPVPFLLVALAFVAFLNWQAWQQDYAPKPAARRRARHCLRPRQRRPSSAEIPKPAGTPAPAAATTSPATGATTITQPLAARPRAHRPARSRHRYARRHRWCRPTCCSIRSIRRIKTHPVRLLDTAPATFFVAQDGLVSSTRSRRITGAIHVGKNRLRTRRRRRQARSAADMAGRIRPQSAQSIHFHARQLLDRNARRDQQRHPAPWTGNEYRQLQRVPPIVVTQRLRVQQSRALSPSPARRGTARRTNSRNCRSTSSPSRRSTRQFAGGWAAMLQHYFFAAWIPAAEETDSVFDTRRHERSARVI